MPKHFETAYSLEKQKKDNSNSTKNQQGSQRKWLLIRRGIYPVKLKPNMHIYMH